MVSKVYSMGIRGVEAFLVEVESDVSRGMPSFDVVGLPGATVRESRERVRASLCNSGFGFPLKRITVNLAPADVKKEGSIYDLPILISILMADDNKTEIKNADIKSSVFVGEISLSGEIYAINGILPMIIKAKELGFKNIFIPIDNSKEGSVVEGINVFGVKDVKSVVSHLCNEKTITPQVKTVFSPSNREHIFDFKDVKGQYKAKRALEIAAAGGHNVLLIGPPGTGKSMLAKRVPSILPDMTFEEMLETTKIHSVVGFLDKEKPFVTERPFRAPHHTVSPAGLSGGGSVPHPGEISLSHNGVLFLDELPEFSRSAMEILRQPIEDGKVTISRVRSTLTYPCDIMLVAAMNPCPCGYFNHPQRPCTCSQKAISKYLSKVSGPLLDRIDLHVEVCAINYESISSKNEEESSQEIRKRVNEARKIQNIRYKNTNIKCNARLSNEMMNKSCVLTDKAQLILKKAFEKMGLSARAYDKILKVARTIADLDGNEQISDVNIAEAIQYRNLDRKYWFGQC